MIEFLQLPLVNLQTIARFIEVVVEIIAVIVIATREFSKKFNFFFTFLLDQGKRAVFNNSQCQYMSPRTICALRLGVFVNVNVDEKS